MPGLATRRLIDAAAALAPADRALLNLWVHRGLDDERLARLTGMSAASVAARRAGIVGRLSRELGLPEADVVGALGALEPESGPEPEAAAAVAEPQLATATPDTLPPDTLPPAAATPETLPPATAQPTEPPPTEPTTADAPRRRPGVWAVLAAAIAIAVVVVVLVIALRSGGSSTRAAVTSAPAATTPAATSAAAATTPAATSTPAATTSPATSSTAAAPTPSTPSTRPDPFGSLPGGLTRATGTVRLIGSGRTLRLRLTVSNLPGIHGGHYEAWLYDSVLDSRPLGRLRAGHAATYLLPAGARHYRSIDVSFQPRGVVNHSGESRLRAANPAHVTTSDARPPRVGAS